MAITRPAAMWPLTITAGVNDKINFNRGAVKTATVAAGTYYTPASLAAAVQTALTTADGVVTFTVGVSTTGRIVVTCGSAFSLLFSTGANAATSMRDVLGFGAVDTASSTTATSTNQHQNAWYGDRSVGFDGAPHFKRMAAQTVSLAQNVRSVVWSESELRSITLTNIPASKTKIDREGSALNEAIERLWRDGHARFRWFPDQTQLGTGTDYALDLDDLKSFDPPRLPSKELYTVEWKFRRYV